MASSETARYVARGHLEKLITNALHHATAGDLDAEQFTQVLLAATSDGNGIQYKQRGEQLILTFNLEDPVEPPPQPGKSATVDPVRPDGTRL